MAVYRVNKSKGYTVMANYHLQDNILSLKSVGLLTKMLSFPDGWNFSTGGLAAICKEGTDAIQSALKELEQHGYLARHRQRDDKGRIAHTIFEIYEKPKAVPQVDAPHRDKPHGENPDVDNPDKEKPHGKSPSQSITNKSNTKESNTDFINYPSIKDETQDFSDRIDEIKSREEYEEIVKDNLDYEIISHDKQYGKAQLDEIVTLIVDTLCSPAPTVRINDTDLPKAAVAERLLQLDSGHIDYVMFAMERSKPDVKNIRAYLLTACIMLLSQWIALIPRFTIATMKKQGGLENEQKGLSLRCSALA